jgi:ankyrin repeat protein
LAARQGEFRFTMASTTVLERLFQVCDWKGMVKRLDTQEGRWEAKQRDSRQELLLNKDVLYRCPEAANVAKSLIYCHPDGLLEQEIPHPYPIFVALIHEADEEIIQAMLEVRPSCAVAWDEAGSLPLHYAVAFCTNKRVIKLMLGALPEEWTSASNHFERRRSVKNSLGQSLLHLCVIYRGNEKDLFALLLQMFPEDVAAKDKTGQLPLHWACRGGTENSCFDVILSAHPEGARSEDHYGFLPLHVAVEHGDRKSAEHLVRSLVDLYPEAVHRRDKISGNSPLMLACRHPSKFHLIPLLLQGKGAVAAETRTLRGELPLHVMATSMRAEFDTSLRGTNNANGNELAVPVDWESSFLALVTAHPGGVLEPDPSTGGNIRHFPLGVVSMSGCRPSSMFWAFIGAHCDQSLLQVDVSPAMGYSTPLSNCLKSAIRGLQINDSGGGHSRSDGESICDLLSNGTHAESILLRSTSSALMRYNQSPLTESSQTRDIWLGEDDKWFHRLMFCGRLIPPNEFSTMMHCLVTLHEDNELRVPYNKLDALGNTPLHVACHAPLPSWQVKPCIETGDSFVQQYINAVPPSSVAQALIWRNANYELPLHIALENRSMASRNSDVVLLVDLCPETAAARDHESGMYPFMILAHDLANCQSVNQHKYLVSTLVATYKLLYYFVAIQNVSSSFNN